MRERVSLFYLNKENIMEAIKFNQKFKCANNKDIYGTVHEKDSVIKVGTKPDEISEEMAKICMGLNVAGEVKAPKEVTLEEFTETLKELELKLESEKNSKMKTSLKSQITKLKKKYPQFEV
jgi:hypothetical protein